MNSAERFLQNIVSVSEQSMPRARGPESAAYRWKMAAFGVDRCILLKNPQFMRKTLC